MAHQPLFHFMQCWCHPSVTSPGFGVCLFQFTVAADTDASVAWGRGLGIPVPIGCPRQAEAFEQDLDLYSSGAPRLGLCCALNMGFERPWNAAS